MRANAKIHFVELPGADLPETARFYTLAFGWRFCGFSDDVVQSDEPGVVGRWVKDPQHRLVQPRVMIYAEDLLLMERDVQIAGGVITRRIHRARGGWRFLFRDPSGNELGVWSDRFPAPRGPSRVGHTAEVIPFPRRRPEPGDAVDQGLSAELRLAA